MASTSSTGPAVSPSKQKVRRWMRVGSACLAAGWLFHVLALAGTAVSIERALGAASSGASSKAALSFYLSSANWLTIVGVGVGPALLLAGTGAMAVALACNLGAARAERQRVAARSGT